MGTDPYCLVASAAMVLDSSIEAIHDFIGHDGTKIVFPEYENNHRLQGVHIREIMEYAQAMKRKTLVPIERYPAVHSAISGRPVEIWDADIAERRFKTWILGRRAILVGETSSGNVHACAWWDQERHDPRHPVPRSTALSDMEFDSKIAWVVIDLI
jgi:hypothetical protein